MCNCFGTTSGNFKNFFLTVFVPEDLKMRKETIKWYEDTDMETWKVLLTETLILAWDLIQNIQRNWSSFDQILVCSVYNCTATPFHCWMTNQPTVFSWLSKIQFKCIEWLKAHRPSNFEEWSGCPGNTQVTLAGQLLCFRGLIKKLE